MKVGNISSRHRVFRHQCRLVREALREKTASGIWDSSSASGDRGYNGDPRNRPISGRRADLRVSRKEIGKSGNSDFGVAAPRFPRNSGNPGFGDILLRVGVPTSRCSVFRPADLRGAVSSDVAVALFGRVSANGARNLGFQIGQPAPRFRGRYAHRAADLHTTGGLAIFSGKFGEFRKFGFRQQSATAVYGLRRPFFDVAVASWVRRFRPKTGSEIRGSKLARRRRGLGGQPLRKSGKFGPTRASAISRKKSGNLKIQTSEFRRQFVGEVYNLAAPRFLT